MNLTGSPFVLAVLRVLLGFLAWAQFAARMRPDWALERPLELAWTSAFWIASPLLVVGFWSRTSALVTGVICLGHRAVVEVGLGRAAPDPSFAPDAAWLLALATILLAATPCGATGSVDRELAARRGLPPEPVADLWGLVLLRILLGGFLFWTALDLTSVGWASGVRLEHWIRHLYLGSRASIPLWLEAAAGGIGVCSCVAAWAVAIGVWVPRWRAPAAVGVIVLAGLVQPFVPLGVLPFTAATLALAFLDPDTFRRRFDELRGVAVAR